MHGLTHGKQQLAIIHAATPDGRSHFKAMDMGAVDDERVLLRLIGAISLR
jgi:hypothetical protein